MTQQLKAAGAWMEGVYYCPHTGDEACDCRKPKPGMLERAARELGLYLPRSFVVGDRYGDIGLARRVVSPGILVRTSPAQPQIPSLPDLFPPPPTLLAYPH